MNNMLYVGQYSIIIIMAVASRLTPVPLRSPKLSNNEPGRYTDGCVLKNTRDCRLGGAAGVMSRNCYKAEF